MNTMICRSSTVLFALLLLCGCERGQQTDSSSQADGAGKGGAATSAPGSAEGSQAAKELGFSVDWRCLACNHTEHGPAGPGPRTCPVCGTKDMWASIVYMCTDHGPIPVALQYDESGKPSRIRVGEGDWTDAVGEDANPVCPQCGKRLFVKAVTRTVFDFDVTWRCLACGHTEEGKAAVGPKNCPACSKPELWVSIDFSCPEHGVFPVAFQYAQSGKVTQIRVADGDWKPQLDETARKSNLRCPRCNKPMIPPGAPQPGARPPGQPSGD